MLQGLREVPANFEECLLPSMLLPAKHLLWSWGIKRVFNRAEWWISWLDSWGEMYAATEHLRACTTTSLPLSATWSIVHSQLAPSTRPYRGFTCLKSSPKLEFEGLGWCRTWSGDGSHVQCLVPENRTQQAQCSLLPQSLLSSNTSLSPYGDESTYYWSLERLI